MNFVEYNLDDARTAYYHPDGWLEIAGQRYDSAIILGDKIMPIVEQSVADLTFNNFQAALDAGATLIIIGTGNHQQFLSPDVMVKLVQNGVGVECMNTAAACRTMAMVQGDGRKVWAWLWIS